MSIGKTTGKRGGQEHEMASGPLGCKGKAAKIPDRTFPKLRRKVAHLGQKRRERGKKLRNSKGNSCVQRMIKSQQHQFHPLQGGGVSSERGFKKRRVGMTHNTRSNIKKKNTTRNNEDIISRL